MAAGKSDLPPDAAVEISGLALDLMVDRVADGGDGGEVFQLDLGTERVGFVFPQGDVYITTELAFLHIRIGDVALLEDYLQRAEIGEGFLRAVEIRLGNDLHERRARAVEVDERLSRQAPREITTKFGITPPAE